MGSEVILTSNLWTEVGLHDGAKVKMINFVYIDALVPRNGVVPEAVVVQFRSLSGEDDIKLFIGGNPRNVTIPMKQVEWKHNVKTLIRMQFPLMLSWAITIHKSQRHTLELAEIDLGTS